jgi:adenosylcobyric acid synthase
VSLALMLQGTGSDVGKSLVAAGLCRAYTRRGLAVRPFKPQNMSNNAAVTMEGGEIGRAQALQARACRVAPSVDMNPVLLKPETDRGAQVIVRGRRVARLDARGYMAKRQEFLPAVLNGFAALSLDADLIIVEGAGSPAEINLRDGDIANMGFAAAAGVPVLLVADIHRGGVIASIVGTFEVLSPGDRGRIAAFLVNNFHGDPALFADGVDFLVQRTGCPCAGVVPHFPAARHLPAEDAVALERAGSTGNGTFHIAVPRFSRIANFDDLDPLRLEPAVRLTIVQPGAPIPADADLILLPGSKSTLGDLDYLRRQGWDIDILAHARRGGAVLGLCGGYQMLGRAVHDPDGIEGEGGSVDGLGLLEVETVLEPAKRLANVGGTHRATGAPLTGYEMHLGRTEGADRARHFALVEGKEEGATSLNGRIAGTYLHGLFASDGFRHAYLSALGAAGAKIAYEALVEETLDRLAQHLEAHVDLDLLLRIAGGEARELTG